MNRYFTLTRIDGKEYPCNKFTKRWGWLVRLKNKLILSIWKDE